MNVIMVGTGNVAVVVSRLLVAAGHSIVEVYGRNKINAEPISGLTGAKVVTDFSQMNKEADVCVLAVSDAAIAQVSNQLDVDEMLVVHTSGATSKDVLNCFINYGVLYPLQSLRKEREQIPPIPFLVDANAKNNIYTLQQLVISTGNEATMADDNERLHFHIAAVLCSNFTNHLYALADNFCKKESIDFKKILPLIKETGDRLQYFPAAQMQTGPAIRHDELTIQKHLIMLQAYPELNNLYRLLTADIQAFSNR